jgi:ornithine cyclodeaminase
MDKLKSIYRHINLLYTDPCILNSSERGANTLEAGMVYLTRDDARELLDMESCVPLMVDTLKALSRKEATQVLRSVIKLGDRNVLGIMPATMDSMKLAGAKVITVFPGNFSKGLPSHQGVVLIFETETGALKAAVDGDAITGIRTAACSAAATGALARKDAKVLAILGSGLQARAHLSAMRLVREITEVLVWDIDIDSAKRFKLEMEEAHGLPVTECQTSRDATRAADIICTVTAAKSPVLFGDSVKPGAHINAVGACSPDCRELDTNAVAKAKLFGDSRESALAEAGDLLIPIKEGALAESHFLGELGDVLLGRLAGRTLDTDITIFESLGLAVEDLASAEFIYERHISRRAQGLLL